MAAKKVGDLIKEARTAAGLTQEKLAKAVGGGLTANDISKAEHGEKELTQAQLKKIAKATGVTQASLINAAKGTSAKSTKTTKSTSTKSTKTSAKSTSSSSSIKVTASEKKIVEAFREATADQKKAALYILKGECNDLVDDVIRKHANDDGGIADFLGEVLGSLLGNK